MNIDENSPITFCISTYNNLPYLKIAVESVRNNSFYKDAPFIVHAENCTDGTNEWLEQHGEEWNLEYYIERDNSVPGIGQGMNFCADKVKTEYIMFLHSDFYVTKDWDKACYDVIRENPDKKQWVFSHRVEPKMFPGSNTRPGTIIVEKADFGAYHYDFNKEYFDQYADQFTKENFTYRIPKAEGVSGLIKKSDWDEIGGNDPLFAPASWEDMDLFLRMQQAGFDFILTGSSLIWHFGARGSHRLEENDGKSSDRQLEAERNNQEKWLKKWNGLPVFDQFGMIIGTME